MRNLLSNTAREWMKVLVEAVVIWEFNYETKHIDFQVQ